MKPTAFKIAAVSGLLLIACSVVLMLVNPQAENNLPSGFFTPVIAFEFIRSLNEVRHFFQVKDPAAYEQAMLMGNWIDYAFMCLYSFFLLCLSIGIRQLTKVNTLYLAILLCLAMLAGDALENYEIYQIILNYKSGHIEYALWLLNIFTWLKWGSIASAFLLLSPFFFSGKLFHKLIGLLCLSSFGLGIAAYLQHGILNEIFSLNVVLVFLLLVIFALSFKSKAAKAYRH